MSQPAMFCSGEHLYVDGYDTITIKSSILDAEQPLENAVVVLVGATKTTAQNIFKAIRAQTSEDVEEAFANITLVWFSGSELVQYSKSKKFSSFTPKKSQYLVYLSYCGSNHVSTEVTRLPTSQFVEEKEVVIPVIPISDKVLNTSKADGGQICISPAACHNDVVLKSGESFKSPILVSQLGDLPVYWLTMVAQMPNVRFSNLTTSTKNYQPQSGGIMRALWSLLRFFSFLYFAAVILQHGIIKPATELSPDCLAVDLPLILDYLHNLDYAGFYASRIQPLVDLARNTDYRLLWEDAKNFDFTSLARTETWLSFYRWLKGIYEVVEIEEVPIEYSTVQDLITVDDASDVVPYTRPVAIEVILMLLSKTFTSIRGILSYAAGLILPSSN